MSEEIAKQKKAEVAAEKAAEEMLRRARIQANVDALRLKESKRIANATAATAAAVKKQQ